MDNELANNNWLNQTNTYFFIKGWNAILVLVFGWLLENKCDCHDELIAQHCLLEREHCAVYCICMS
jgi:hypothetical protein